MITRTEGRRNLPQRERKKTDGDSYSSRKRKENVDIGEKRGRIFSIWNESEEGCKLSNKVARRGAEKRKFHAQKTGKKRRENTDDCDLSNRIGNEDILWIREGKNIQRTKLLSDAGRE